MEFNELKSQIELGVDPKKLFEFKNVGLIEQKKIINMVKSACLIETDNGFTKVDFVLKDMFTLLYIVINYTNIEIEESLYINDNINTVFAIEIFDLFKKHKLDEFIYIESGCDYLIHILDKEIEQELNINNSVSFIVKKTLDGLISKLPSEENIKGLMSEIPKLLNSVVLPTSTSTPKKRTSTKKS